MENRSLRTVLTFIGLFSLSVMLTTGCAQTEVKTDDQITGAAEPQKEQSAESLFSGDTADKGDKDTAEISANTTDTATNDKQEDAKNVEVKTEAAAADASLDAAAAVEPAPTTVAVEAAPVAAAPIMEEAAPVKKHHTKSLKQFESEVTQMGVGETLNRMAMSQNGVSINRYYFLRIGDTAQKVAELIYGDASKEKDLTKWNSGTWSTGRKIWYSSPVDPADSKVDSFYSERGVKGEEYVVKDGEDLKKIANTKYGSPDSWKEVAALNNLTKHKLAVGQTLVLMPTQFTTAKKDEVAKVDVKTTPTKDVGKVAVNGFNQVAAPNANVAPKALVNVNPAVIPPHQPDLASPEIGGVTETPNFWSFGFYAVVGVVCFLIVYTIVRRMRKPKSHDFFE